MFDSREEPDRKIVCLLHSLLDLCEYSDVVPLSSSLPRVTESRETILYNLRLL